MPVQDIVELRNEAIQSRREYLEAVDPILQLYLKEVKDIWTIFYKEEGDASLAHRRGDISRAERRSRCELITGKRDARLKKFDDSFRSSLGLPTRDIGYIIRWTWRNGDRTDILFD